MLFSVIIPTFKRRDLLGSCLEQIAPGKQSLAPENYEVVVTDDEGGDLPSFLAEKFPWARHNPGPQKGPASNRNSGAKAARGEWLIFLDDDCLPQPGFLTAYISAMKKYPGSRVFEGRTLAERPKQRLDEEAPINDHGGYLWSCNFLIDRNLFFELGGFWEGYPYACMEDVDFREQLKLRGITFPFVPEASVVHPWRSLAPEEKFLRMRVVSHALFYERYPALRPTFFMTLRVILRLWVLLLFYEAPRLGFRGFSRFFARQVTLTQDKFLIWNGAKEPR